MGLQTAPPTGLPSRRLLRLKCSCALRRHCPGKAECRACTRLHRHAAERIPLLTVQVQGAADGTMGWDAARQFGDVPAYIASAALTLDLQVLWSPLTCKAYS